MKFVFSKIIVSILLIFLFTMNVSGENLINLTTKNDELTNKEDGNKYALFACGGGYLAGDTSFYRTTKFAYDTFKKLGYKDEYIYTICRELIVKEEMPFQIRKT